MIDTVFPGSEDCPDCGGWIFRPGPRAGVSQNIECVGCGSRFNIARWSQYWDQRFGYDTRLGKMPIVWAQRIPNDGEWREDMFPKVLQ